MAGTLDRIATAQPYLIAEIANAHNGDLGQLDRLIDAAAAAGSHGIKLHWYRYDHLATPEYPWYEHYVKLFIDEPQWAAVLTRCHAARLDIWVDIFDRWGCALAERYRDQLTGLKIPPTVALEPELPLRVLRIGKPTLLGLGGHDEQAIKALMKRFADFRSQLILMHGFQAYPTKPEDAKLGRLMWLKQRFGRPVGYADHGDGSSQEAMRLPEYAVFAGAEVIEKHLCLDRAAKGYDYYSSLEPKEFAELATRLRRCQILVGGEGIGEAERTYLTDAATRALTVRSIAEGDWVLPEDVCYRRTSEKQALLPDQMQALLPAVVRRSLEAQAPILSDAIRKLRIVAMVACRLKSTRLPNKALMPLYGVPSIERCLLNALAIRQVDAVVLATSTHEQDAPLAAHTIGGRVTCFRGSEEDVVERFLGAAEAHQADLVLRITGDCPVVSYEIADLLISSHLTTRADFTFCEHYAPGTACEVYTVEALRRLKQLKPDTNHSEYLMFYFKNNPSYFRLNEVTLPEQFRHPEWRVTLDEPADAELFNRLFAALDAGREAVGFERISQFFARNPEAAQINQGVALKWVHNREFVDFLNRVTTIDGASKTERSTESVGPRTSS